MGCWNGTCGLSGLPIIEGEEMYVFPIVESYRDSFCYSTALYRPSVVPFRAKYNDYGAGEDCSGPALELLMSGIRERLVELEVGENQYHDIAVKREGFGVDTFFEACHKKRLRFDNPLHAYEGEAPHKDVFFTMVRKDVVDRLWSEWTFDMYKGSDIVVPDSFGSDKYYIKNVTYEKMASLIPEYLESCLENTRIYLTEIVKPKNEIERMSYTTRALQSFFSDQRNHILSSSYGHAFDSGYASGGFYSIGSISHNIITEYLTGNKETAYELMREVLVGIMVNSFMESTRKIWTPPMHKGSQSQEYDEYLLLNRITDDVIRERKAEYDEEYDE